MGGAVASLFAQGAQRPLWALDLGVRLDLSAAPLDDERSFPFDGPVVAYTYGAPRVGAPLLHGLRETSAGNAAFRSVYNALVPQAMARHMQQAVRQTFRVVGSRDVVPTLPPSIVYRLGASRPKQRHTIDQIRLYNISYLIM